MAAPSSRSLAAGAALVAALSLAGAKAFEPPLHALRWSADSRRVLASGEHGAALVLDERGKGGLLETVPDEPRLTPDGLWVVGAREEDFLAVNVETGETEVIPRPPNKGRPVSYERTAHGDVMVLRSSAHHELVRLGPEVVEGGPAGLDNLVAVWADPRDPLLYLDSGYGLELRHQWTGALLRAYDGGRRDQRVIGAVRDEDGRLLVALRDADGFRIWTPPDPVGPTWDVPDDAPVSLSGDGRYVAVAAEGAITLYATANQSALLSLPFRGAVAGLAASPDGRHVAVATDAGLVKVLDVSKVAAPPPFDRPVSDLDTGRIRAEALRAPQPPVRRPTSSLAMPGSTVALAWSPTGRVSGWVGNGFVELDPATGARLTPTVPLLPGTPYAWSTDGTVLAGVTERGVALVDTRNRARWKVLKEIPSGGGHHQLAWNGPTLVVDDGSGRARAWDPVTQTPFGETYTTSPEPTARFVLSPDGAKVIVTGKVPVVLDSRSGARLVELAGHAGGVVTAAWRPDGGAFATAGAEGALLVWDAQSFQPTTMIDGALGVRIAWSPDGKQLVSASTGEAVLVDAVAARVSQVLAVDGLLGAVAWSDRGVLVSDNAGNLSFWAP